LNTDFYQDLAGLLLSQMHEVITLAKIENRFLSQGAPIATLASEVNLWAKQSNANRAALTDALDKVLHRIDNIETTPSELDINYSQSSFSIAVEEKRVENWLANIEPQTLSSESGGDVVQVTIGDHATKVAAGKNVTQAIQCALGPTRQDDAEQVRIAIKKFRRKFSKLEDTLTEVQMHVGRDKIELLARELSQKEGEPSGDLIREAGNWLLDNIPEIAEDLLELFMPSSVGRIIAKAGTRTIKWIKELYIRLM
jgi:hypothetical protein